MGCTNYEILSPNSINESCRLRQFKHRIKYVHENKDVFIRNVDMLIVFNGINTKRLEVPLVMPETRLTVNFVNVLEIKQN